MLRKVDWSHKKKNVAGCCLPCGDQRTLIHYSKCKHYIPAYYKWTDYLVSGLWLPTMTALTFNLCFLCALYFTGEFLSSHAKTTWKPNMEIIYPRWIIIWNRGYHWHFFPPWTVLLRRVRHLTPPYTFSAFCRPGLTKLSLICHKLLSMQLLS